ncbi:MAG: TerC family protein [Bacteroidetes bacterium]|nr:TerC family protein [Bacteroidota bacterium]
MTIWLLFLVLITALLALDLGVFHKKDEVLKYSSAMLWSIFWIVLSLLFGLVVYFLYDHPEFNSHSNIHSLSPATALIQYYTGYIIEKSLSLDNIFVIVLIFQYFKIPDKYQHKVLFWGILGAILLRGVMIIFGVALIQEFAWLLYVFGVFLIYTSIKMYLERDKVSTPQNNFIYKKIVSKIRYVDTYEHGHFFIFKDGLRYATPLFLALIVIELSDVVFAVDSIPAIFSVTLDPFIIFTSNIFAILGLRSLYFVLAALINKFRYLKYSLIFILFYIGIKMVVVDLYHIPTVLSLTIILTALTLGIVLSLYNKSPEESV